MSEEETKTVKATPTSATVKTKAKEEEEETSTQHEDEGGFKKFLWNSDKKEFLGRGGKSWALIGLFYLTFFGFVVAFFFFSWFMALTFTSISEPYYSAEDSILGSNGPAISYRPYPDRKSNKGSTIIRASDNPEFYRFWANQLDQWYGAIPILAKGKSCGPGNGNGADNKACFIDKTQYAPCNTKPYGFDVNEPCILLKLNRIYGWKPEPYAQSDLNRNSIKQEDEVVKIPPGMQTMVNSAPGIPWGQAVIIWCEGENPHDKMNLGSIKYIPGPYIHAYYFPFKGQKNYQSPFIMIQLKRPMPGALISIVCRAFAKNILINKETGVGYFKFQVYMG